MSGTGPVGPVPLRPEAPAGGGLEPERDTRGALSRLVEVLLDKGVYLDLDLLVTVAEVPLIAVDLRATIAGVETMIEYGMLGAWGTPPAGPAQPALPRSAPRPVDLGDAVLESAAWYREARAALPVWREGTLVLGRSGSVRWQGRGDRRASLRLSRDDLRGVRIRPAPAPVGDRVLELRTESATAELAGGDLERWATLLRAGEEDQAGIAGTGAPT